MRQLSGGNSVRAAGSVRLSRLYRLRSLIPSAEASSLREPLKCLTYSRNRVSSPSELEANYAFGHREAGLTESRFAEASAVERRAWRR